MLIELSTLNTPAKHFWETVDKQPPIYSISDSELKKARVQHSIGIVEPRVNVTKLGFIWDGKTDSWGRIS